MRPRDTAAMGAAAESADSELERRVKTRRSVIGLLVLALAIYFGFILMMAWR